MKKNITALFTFLSICIYSQKDSLQVGDTYWEDQLYINVTYNVLNDQPDGIDKSGFSFGFSGGYIKDIPINKNGRKAIGVGLGYSFDSFNHSLKITNSNPVVFETATNINANKLKLHNVELPIEFRWRTSSVNTYSFWRIYTGVKFSYNFANNYSYNENGTEVSFSNISEFNKLQAGVTLSVGYGTFNFHVYYGLTSLFKDAYINNEPINTKILRFGLSFYLL